MKRYDIPGFSRYEVRTNPFRVVSKHYGTPLSLRNSGNRRGYDRVRMRDDSGKTRALSVLTVAALAFHGQCPAGYVAHHTGGEMTSATVTYRRESEVHYMRFAKVTYWEALTILDWYFEHGLTQKQIARKINAERKRLKHTRTAGRGSDQVTETDIWYAINRSPFSPYRKTENLAEEHLY